MDLILKLIISCLILSYMTWNGVILKTGSFYYELYPMRRFFFQKEYQDKQKQIAEDIDNVYALMMSNKSLLREDDDYMKKIHSLKRALKLLREEKKRWF